ncbi:3'(2'),5'-bisphosphate nucleotidase CysQ [Psychromonas marina]|uniref:3'(2'),5'-bisphosphate nucleotidase CysQ n=1 Tax=Psychromonas marina TaxID=88364 RepID=A0ABQ6E2R6_9GAMM|nr:inositol monophosphatase family protein [Psychromonas marina]GLS91698.1 3'(2'),5'-bisphosphate nucleotidase CysQ [Psychromonas marina]
MHFSITQLNQLSSIALKAATLAGQYIKQFDRSQLKTNFKVSGSSLSSQVVTEVDLHCQGIIIEQLQVSCEHYDIALLSEENCTEVLIDQHPRLRKSHFWCIDPLDGTLPFIEGTDGYAVSIALVDKSGTPILAAIYLPATSDAYHMKFDTHGKPHVYKNAAVFSPNSNVENKKLKQTRDLSFYCDRSFLTSKQYPALIQQLTALLPTIGLTALKVISGNGAVVNALLVLENAPACYIKIPKHQQGGGALWDFSATTCISQAVNAWASDIHGLPLQLNQHDSYYMNKKGVMFASDRQLGEILLTALA